MRIDNWQGYADCKPSESIQKHDMPGISVSVVFCTSDQMGMPVRQYKDYGVRQKAKAADLLYMYLTKMKLNRDVIVGAVNVHSMKVAALLGIEMLEELPEASTRLNYGTYKLHYVDGSIDLAQAVALQYYLLTLSFGILRAGISQNKCRRLTACLDRFPGCSVGSQCR